MTPAEVAEMAAFHAMLDAEYIQCMEADTIPLQDCTLERRYALYRAHGDTRQPAPCTTPQNYNPESWYSYRFEYGRGYVQVSSW